MVKSVKQYPDIFINGETEESLKNGASKIVSLIKPSWRQEDFLFKIFTDGISNKLIGVYVDNVGKTDMVLVRVYGAKTELIIDRNAEIRNMTVLDQVGCGCELYARFANGLAYEFLPGETLTINSAKLPTIYPSVASAMAKMHKLVDLGPQVPREPCMWKKLHMFVEQYPAEDEFPDTKRLAENNISRQRLTAEVLLLEKKLKGCKSPIVFTHNDLLLANIVINHNEKSDDGSSKVSFIDYEYGDYNYQECDIANHFDEMAGVEDMDFLSDYPTKEFQLAWIRAYLETYDGCTPDEARIMTFYVNVAHFSLCYHMMWGLWGLVQAKISKIEFDFIGFALGRLGEYFRVRDERLALKND